MSLIDRNFEEVCAIMDHTGDTVELLVEHATDLRMCDFLDEPPLPPPSVRKPSEANITALHVGKSRKNLPELKKAIKYSFSGIVEENAFFPRTRLMIQLQRRA